MNTFRATILSYGIPNEEGDIVTEQAALEVFDRLQRQAEARTEAKGVPGFYLAHVTIEGDRTSGKIVGTFKPTDDKE